ncbi:MAG: DUF2157 domain-containing protein [Parvibaculum sedimenti]|uniref:DUF2157 domain-containing protein n=1 Tax=Parvibaculum sedimenti TaxID=2608632 RepID=UPI003BB55AF5
MWQRVYLQRLKHDLELWIERGWVTPQNAEAILASASGEATVRRIPQLLALFGAVLIGFAAMSFVAANWAELSKLTKLVLLMGAMWAAYGAAFVLDRREHPAFAQAAIVGGLALFGANIMLIAQIYHVSADNPGWLLLWCLVSLASAWALPSRPALGLAFLLTSLWSFSVTPGEGQVHWSFFLPWAASLALALRLNWLSGLHLAILTTCAWAAFSIDPLSAALGCGWNEIAAIYLVVSVLIWLGSLRVSATSMRFGSTMEAYGIVLSFGFFWVLQAMPPEHHVSGSWIAIITIGIVAVAAFLLREWKAKRLSTRDAAGFAALAGFGALYPAFAAAVPALVPWLYAGLFIALGVWLVAYGSGQRSRFALNAGFAAFAGEVLYLYFETLGTLLDTAAFFALGGVILIAGAYALARVRKRVVNAVDEGSAE